MRFQAFGYFHRPFTSLTPIRPVSCVPEGRVVTSGCLEGSSGRSCPQSSRAWPPDSLMPSLILLKSPEGAITEQEHPAERRGPDYRAGPGKVSDRHPAPRGQSRAREDHAGERDLLHRGPQEPEPHVRQQQRSRRPSGAQAGRPDQDLRLPLPVPRRARSDSSEAVARRIAEAGMLIPTRNPTRAG